MVLMLVGLLMCAVGLLALAVQAARLRRQLRLMQSWRRAERRRALEASEHWRTLYTTRAKAQLARAGRSVALPMRFLSEDGEDRLLWDLLGDRPPGFYIECGAADGLINSVTYVLEAAGWRGLLIEPQQAWAQRARVNRPGSTVAHTACSAPGGPTQVTFRTVSGGEESAGLMASLASVDDQRALDSKGFTLGSVQVPCTTMDALLAPLTTHVDVLVLDVEGAELDVLKGFSLNVYRPLVLVIESINQQDDAIRALVEPAGYVFIARVARNLLLVRADETGLVDRALSLVTLPAHLPGPSQASFGGK